MHETKIGVLLRLWAAMVAAILIAPLIVVIPLSFTEQKSFRFPPSGWSLKWYENIWRDPTWRDAVVTSLQLGVLVMIIATVIGTAAALALHRMGKLPRQLTQGTLLLPVVVPGIVVAVAIYGVFLKIGLVGTWLGFLASHTALAVPFVVVAVMASLQHTDPAQLRAAASLGAGPIDAFRTVTLPAIMPGVASGALFAFATSFDEVVVGTFLQSPEIRTLPVEMFVSITQQVDPTIAAVATMITLLTTFGILVAATLRPRNEDT